MHTEVIDTPTAIRHDQRDLVQDDRPNIGEFPLCHKCDRAFNREHWAFQETKKPTEFITYTYCDHCDEGLETLWIKRGGRWYADCRLSVRGTDLNEFLRILEALTCA